MHLIYTQGPLYFLNNFTRLGSHIFIDLTQYAACRLPIQVNGFALDKVGFGTVTSTFAVLTKYFALPEIPLYYPLVLS